MRGLDILVLAGHAAPLETVEALRTAAAEALLATVERLQDEEEEEEGGALRSLLGEAELCTLFMVLHATAHERTRVALEKVLGPLSRTRAGLSTGRSEGQGRGQGRARRAGTGAGAKQARVTAE